VRPLPAGQDMVYSVATGRQWKVVCTVVSGGESLALLILIVILLGVAAFYFSRMRMKIALRSVVNSFYERGALQAKKAATPRDLGVVPLDVFSRMMRLRDYRPQALRLLVNAGIVIATDDGLLYMSEDLLRQSNISHLAKKE
jgi:hypothetical protein